LSGIRTHVPGVRASEDISCLDRAATVIGKIFHYGSVNYYALQIIATMLFHSEYILLEYRAELREGLQSQDQQHE
jgi:hypothetical protein